MSRIAHPPSQSNVKQSHIERRRWRCVITHVGARGRTRDRHRRTQGNPTLRTELAHASGRPARLSFREAGQVAVVATESQSPVPRSPQFITTIERRKYE